MQSRPPVCTSGLTASADGKGRCDRFKRNARRLAWTLRIAAAARSCLGQRSKKDQGSRGNLSQPPQAALDPPRFRARAHRSPSRFRALHRSLSSGLAERTGEPRLRLGPRPDSQRPVPRPFRADGAAVHNPELRTCAGPGQTAFSAPAITTADASNQRTARE